MTCRHPTPAGMNRRHFMAHLAGASALAVPALSFAQTWTSNAEQLRRDHKSAILLWMGGGPATIDIWDLKPGTPTGGPFKPIATTGDVQICELLPNLAQQMQHLSLIRSMSTREADHSRGRYYMHTGYVPNPSIEHPRYGSVVAHEMEGKTAGLAIPPFISIGGPSEGPGFLGMAYAPYTVDSSGRVRNLQMEVQQQRLLERMQMLSNLEKSFIAENRGAPASDHAEILAKTLDLMTSQQIDAFRVDQEPQAARDRYGDSDFGRGCLMARRLVEVGVPFVEVDFGGWDNHRNVHTTLQTKLPQLDQAMSALVDDLAQRGLLRQTVIIWMGEFGRTPRINGNAGRDHWARSWTAVVGGGAIQGGQAIGSTSADGSQVETEPFSSQDLMASVCHALDISLETVFHTPSGRPMKIANSGKVIEQLFD